MPTRRWMYIAPISLFCVAAELIIMFGGHWEAIKSVLSAPEELEELNGKFYIFVALMVGQAALWGYLGSLCGEWVWQIWSSFCKNGPSLRRLPRHYWGAILTRFVSVWAAVGVWYYIVRQIHLSWNWDLGPYSQINIRDAGLPGFVLGALGVSAMWVVEIAVYSSLPPDDLVTPTHLECYLRLREYLGNFLTVTGIVLALGTLGLNASWEFVKAANKDNRFPHDLIVVFGGVFTVLLGMAYAPAYLALRTLGSDIRDSIVPPALPDDPKPAEEKGGGFELVEKWAENREKLDDLLQLQIRDWKSFGPQFAIVAPLATGLASRLIGGK